MPFCVVLLAEKIAAHQLIEQITHSDAPINRCELIPPSQNEADGIKAMNKDDLQAYKVSDSYEVKSIESVELLNPSLSRQKRQREMALWLMPFGFLAGLTFSQMTGLKTFENLGLGFGSWSEPLLGGLIGMSAGWIGSYTSAASVRSDKINEISFLRKRSEDGQWLLLLETPNEIDLPWKILRESDHLEIMSLNNL